MREKRLSSLTCSFKTDSVSIAPHHPQSHAKQITMSLVAIKEPIPKGKSKLAVRELNFQLQPQLLRLETISENMNKRFFHLLAAWTQGRLHHMPPVQKQLRCQRTEAQQPTEKSDGFGGSHLPNPVPSLCRKSLKISIHQPLVTLLD
ncbi:hypothetical protein SESBI_13478 [Sesbania bispinosa]|nr:hypothetical protein SESBI_13478 [Sesbania bispinosa]